MPKNLLHTLVDSIYELRRRVNSEETFLRRTLAAHCPSASRLLDVGCGRGRFYPLIQAANLHWTGVDVNPQTLETGLGQGRDIRLASAFPLPGEPLFDAMLFSHVIEHMDAGSLAGFLTHYLALLKPGGIVIFLTPLLHPGFYDDFDHVKPYNPNALRQMLCRSTLQTRPFPMSGVYDEVDLWLKRDPLWHTHRTGRWTHIFGIPVTLACVLTRGLIGRLTGYGMVFRRVS